MLVKGGSFVLPVNTLVTSAAKTPPLLAVRLELGLPVRAGYFFRRTYLNADANFSARYVRLSFERRDETSLQKKRYWLVWDAVTVGGLTCDGQRALVR